MNTPAPSENLLTGATWRHFSVHCNVSGMGLTSGCPKTVPSYFRVLSFPSVGIMFCIGHRQKTTGWPVAYLDASIQSSSCGLKSGTCQNHSKRVNHHSENQFVGDYSIYLQ